VTHLSLGKRARTKQLVELANIAKKIKNGLIILGDFNGENIALNELTCASGKTFPSWNPQRRLDYIFSNGKIKKYHILPWKLSDHLPILAEIEF
jgi:endonuclease/exonuclease/phosphatase family metal-dependent hydrolase